MLECRYPMYKKIFLGMLVAIIALATACATPLTHRERGAITGTLLGAGAGAAIGSITGHAGAGAAIGGAFGLITGALIGDAIQEAEQRAALYGPRYTSYPPPPRPGAIWVPAHYDYRGNWIPGRWIP